MQVMFMWTNEVRKGFLAMGAADYFKSRENAANLAWTLNKALEAGDMGRFRELLTAFL